MIATSKWWMQFQTLSIGSLAEQVKISRCHRFGQYSNSNNTRGINKDYMSHALVGDQSVILDNRLQLPGGISVREDFPAEIEQWRNKRYPILEAARANQKYKGKYKMTVD